MENHKNCDRNLFITLVLCFFPFLFICSWTVCSLSFILETCGFVWVWQVGVGVRSLYELMCNNSHHFPLCLGRHAGIAVHQRLGWLWECVGDTVTETLAQASSAKKEKRVCYFHCASRHCVLHSAARSHLRKEELQRQKHKSLKSELIYHVWGCLAPRAEHTTTKTQDF